MDGTCGLPKCGLAHEYRRTTPVFEALLLIFGRLQTCCSIHSLLTRLQCPPPSWIAAAPPIARRRHDDAACAYDIELDIDIDAHADTDRLDKHKFAQSAARQAEAHRDVV